MSPTLGKMLGRLGGRSHAGRMLNGFIDSLLQSFENYRAGLSDEMLEAGEKTVHSFSLAIYEKEIPRLRATVRLLETGFSEARQQEIFENVDELVRKVVVPAYARLATRFTRRERNDFYLAPESLHGLERIGWGVAGMALGAFVVWAPFIPLWEKEWVLPFVIVGLFLPNIRRYLSIRRYQSELNRIVGHADDEIWRMDLAYLTSVTADELREGEVAPPARQATAGSPGAGEHVRSTGTETRAGRSGEKLKQGGR